MSYPNSSLFRTDLALESLEMNRREARIADALPGIESRETQIEGFSVTTVQVVSQTGAQTLGKPVGTYETLFLDGLMRREEDAFPRACRALGSLVRSLLPQAADAPVLVAGLGNRQITPCLLYTSRCV